MAELSLLKKTILEAPVISRANGYNYFVHPITDGIPHISRELLEEVASALLEESDFRCDKIVTVEAMGIPLATMLTQLTGRPTVIIRKRPYGFPSEHQVFQETGYSKAPLYINGLEKGDRIVFVDDVLSTGGTLVPLMKTFQTLGVVVVDILMVVNRSLNKGELEEKVGRKINCLVNVEICDGKTNIL